jgi:hypothetical protein
VGANDDPRLQNEDEALDLHYCSSYEAKDGPAGKALKTAGHLEGSESRMSDKAEQGKGGIRRRSCVRSSSSDDLHRVSYEEVLVGFRRFGFGYIGFFGLEIIDIIKNL